MKPQAVPPDYDDLLLFLQMSLENCGDREAGAIFGRLYKIVIAAQKRSKLRLNESMNNLETARQSLLCHACMFANMTDLLKREVVSLESEMISELYDSHQTGLEKAACAYFAAVCADK